MNDVTGEHAALRALLDALDRRAPDRLALVAARPREGHLFGPMARHDLDDVEALLVLAALRRRLDGGAPPSGTDLAADVAERSAERLAALTRLTARGRLLAGGFLLPALVPADGPEAGATRYRVGDHVFRLACEVVAPERDTREPEPPARGPYATNAELLADLRRLSLHYRRRAARVFHLDPWTGSGLEVLDATGEVLRRAQEQAARIQARLDATDPLARLPILELRRQHTLDLDALVLLVTLVFCEFLDGVGSVPAADLVKLLSANEGELLARRQMLRPLARKGLLRLEGVYAGKDLTADASLPNDVVDALLGDGAIDADDRLDFHAYLAGLDSSEAFFLDLESGLGGEGGPE